jgi:hypothetical protein
MAKHQGKGEGSKSQGEGKRGTTSSHRHVQQSAHSRDAQKAVNLVQRIAKLVQARNDRARKNQGG